MYSILYSRVPKNESKRWIWKCCLQTANMFLNRNDIAYKFYCLLGCSLSQNVRYARPKPISHLLQAPSDILLHKGYELGFLFSHLSLWWHLQYTCKCVAKWGEHRIINIQLPRAAANDTFAALSVFWGGGHCWSITGKRLRNYWELLQTFIASQLWQIITVLC